MSMRTRTILNEYGQLLLGFLCPVLARFCTIAGIPGVAVLVWLYTFLTLTCRKLTKKQYLLTGISFVAGYCVFFAGAMGNTLAGTLVFVVFGLVLYGILCLTGRVAYSWKRFPVTLIFPVAWLAEYGIAYAVRFPALTRIDMLFADLPVLLQLEHYIGSVGLSFLLVWLVAIFWLANATRRRWQVVIGSALVCLMLLPGIVILYPNVQTEASVRIAYTTGPYIGDFMNYTAVEYSAGLESLERSAAAAAEQGAELLVFNEEAFDVADVDEDWFLSCAAEAAAENDLALLIGLDVGDTDGSENGRSANRAVLIDRHGSIVGSYQKTCLIPILESGYEPGDGNILSCTLELGGRDVKVACMICYDSNFSAYDRQLDPDTEILLLPSWDWSAITALHAKLCCAMAAENRVSVLKATYDGLSVAVSPYGIIMQSSSTDTTGYESVQLVDMPLQSTAVLTTPGDTQSPLVYAIIGTEIMAALLCMLLLIVNSMRSRQRSKRSGWFRALAAIDCVGCCADAMSWILDGSVRLNGILFFTTMISMEMTFPMLGSFVSYLTAYIEERREISKRPMVIAWVFVGVTMLMTTIISMNGSLFSLENGVYSDGRLYNLYVAVNTLSMAFGLAVVLLYRKVLDTLDCLTALIYMIIPIIMAIVNLYVEDWSFAYPSVTISLVLIYVMLQSDQMESLEQQRAIVTYCANHDELTGLFNRRAYNDRIAFLSTVEGSSGIIFADINGLKHANDNFGHEAGDQLLLRYAALVSGIFRSTDLFRISGDEFICLLENIPESTLNDHVASLQEALSHDAPPLACIGAAYGTNQELESVLRQAEDRMYVEKELVHQQYQHLRR